MDLQVFIRSLTQYIGVVIEKRHIAPFNHCVGLAIYTTKYQNNTVERNSNQTTDD